MKWSNKSTKCFNVLEISVNNLCHGVVESDTIERGTMFGLCTFGL